MLKQLVFATTLFGMVAVPSTSSSAEEMTLDKALQAWSFMDGDWTITQADGTQETASIKKAKSGVSWIFDSPSMHGQFGFDGAENKMFAVGFHEGGGHSIGHWMPAGKGIVEGTFKFTKKNGDVTKHTGRFEVKGDGNFTYTLDGNRVVTFERK